MLLRVSIGKSHRVERVKAHALVGGYFHLVGREATPGGGWETVVEQTVSITVQHVAHSTVRKQDVAGAAMDRSELAIVLEHVTGPDSPPAVRTFAWRAGRE